MATRPELHIAVAKTKSKASDYNENFEMMMTYCEDSIEEANTYQEQVLSTYQDINVLSNSGTVALTSNTVNTISPADDITFSLPTVTDNTKFNQIFIQVKITDVYNIDFGTTHYFDLEAPDISEAGNYNLYYEYDHINGNWVCGSVRKG